MSIVFGVTAMVPAESSSPTFNEDVLPILQKNCQSCHRPGQIAPMPFLSYDSTRPWAKAIKAAVVVRKMPPWPAYSQVGHFTNDRSLKQSDIDTLVKWANSGAPSRLPWITFPMPGYHPKSGRGSIAVTLRSYFRD